MSGISRRNFVKASAAVIASAGISGCAGSLNLNFNKQQEQVILPKSGKRVVVLGGGWGGTTAAKYVKLGDPSIEVVLVERLDNFVSCPMSNLVLSGMKSLQEITFTYDALVKNYGIKIIKTEAAGLDAAAKQLITAAGRIEYDKLIVSPGVEFMYDKIEGWSKDAEDVFPHAYKAGRQTTLLREQLVNLNNGENVLLTVPLAPYRCPPGPYERACQIAFYLKNNKKGSKLIVIDANEDIASKGKLFHAAWDDYYKDVIEYVPDTAVKGVDVKSRVVKTTNGDFKGGAANIIPDMKAGSFAYKAGLLPETDRWVRVQAFTLESQALKDVFVLGDSTHAGTVGPVPKSGFVANSMGKVAAAAVVNQLNGKEPLKPNLVNTCYSMVNDREAIFISGVYDYDETTKLIISRGGGLSPERSELYAKHAEDWALSIWSDMLT
ncbi:twin-arginine translocation signal domain-containing protein [Geovibrio thiophilus]|uniref:Twin-arginine translocation signal domain-containing protein n=1 Tax=Geovibrio thiophilus TaxID=139438 RepID=A0A3R5XXF7_9BACT|nr:FCSD flavin-binding domain-containing protein [Geovibrio thiophilus]QAR33614.1 twin-arginine translocation signal domain-containing protein [Geovibrio thiophilus]